jgi:hypothetical protein
MEQTTETREVPDVEGKLHSLSNILFPLMVLVDNSGGCRQMNVMHRTGCESHEFLLHAVADILLNPGRACLKHKVGKSLVGEPVGILVASTFLLQMHQDFVLMVQLLHGQIHSR